MNLQPPIPMTQREYEVLAIITCHVAAWNRKDPNLACAGVNRIHGFCGEIGGVGLKAITFGDAPKPRKSA